MNTNPLARAIESFGGGFLQGQERRLSREERERQIARQQELDAQTQSNSDRQYALQQAMNAFTQQAPVRQEATRLTIKGEQDAEKARVADVLARARRAMAEGRTDAPEVGEAMAARPDLSDEFRLPTPPKPVVTPKYEERVDPKSKRRMQYVDGHFDKWIDPEPPAPDKGPTIVQDRIGEQSLHRDYRSEPVVKDAMAVASALSQVDAALNQNTPLGDLNAIYAMVKLFDPNSVVKEGEIKLTKQANSLDQRVRLLVANWNKGRVISDEMRAQLSALAEETVGTRRASIAPVQSDYGASARRFGADSSFVAPDPFRGRAGPKANPYLKRP